MQNCTPHHVMPTNQKFFMKIFSYVHRFSHEMHKSSTGDANGQKLIEIRHAVTEKASSEKLLLKIALFF